MIRRRKPKADEEVWPYTDPGTRWEVERSPLPVDWQGLTVDWEPTDKQIGSIFLPDGEELEIWSDPIPFGFARYGYETDD